MSLKNTPKRLMKSHAVGRIGSFLIASYIRLVRWTSSWRIDGLEHIRRLEAEDQGFIIAFWHSQLLMTPTLRCETEKRFRMLISTHRDGDIISNAVIPFGIEFIRGSAANPKKKFKDKSGVSALAQMARALKDGDIVGVTPDGPRGPRCKFQPGIVGLSQLIGAPVVPVGYATTHGKHLKTWDRFWLAMPFSKGVFVISDPLWPPAEKTDEALAAFKERLEKGLNQAVATAQSRIGHSPEKDEIG